MDFFTVLQLLIIFFYSLANLNIGGVLTGPPAQPSPLDSLSVKPAENELPSPAATPSSPSPPPLVPPPSQPNWLVFI